MLLEHIYIFIILLSLLGGIIIGIFGSGSGLILMPTYFFALQSFPIAQDMKMQMAITTTVLSTSIALLPALYKHYKNKNIDSYIIRRISPGMIIGAFLAIIFLNIMPSSILKPLFGIIVIMLSIWFIAYKSESDTTKWSINNKRNLTFTAIISFLWNSLGVGAFTVPYLIKCQLNIRKAIGATAVMSIILGCIMGSMLTVTGYFYIGISYNHIGFLNTTFLLLTIPTLMAGSYIGSSISIYIKQDYLKVSLAILTFIVGVIMLL